MRQWKVWLKRDPGVFMEVPAPTADEARDIGARELHVLREYVDVRLKEGFAESLEEKVAREICRRIYGDYGSHVVFDKEDIVLILRRYREAIQPQLELKQKRAKAKPAPRRPVRKKRKRAR